jgi:phosphotransferase system enzyme I (PtsI)
LFHVVNRQKSDQLQKPAPVILKGLGVSAGIVIGRVLVVDTDLRRVPRRTIAREAVKAETARLDAAVKASIDDLHEVQKNAEASMGKEASKIFLAHSFMLRDNKMVISPIKELIASELVNSETAVAQVFGALAARFRKSADSAFTTKVNDIDDLAARVLNKLMGESRGKLKDAPPDSVVIARDLTPSQTASFDRKRIVGFATDLGGQDRAHRHRRPGPGNPGGRRPSGRDPGGGRWLTSSSSTATAAT